MILRYLFAFLVLSLTWLLHTEAKEKISYPASAPLYFIENNGQVTDQYHHPRADIQYVLQAQGITVFIGYGQIHYQFLRKNPDSKAPVPALFDVMIYRMDVTLLNASKNAQTIVENEQAYYENYYLSGHKGSTVKAHSFKRVTYKNV